MRSAKEYQGRAAALAGGALPDIDEELPLVPDGVTQHQQQEQPQHSNKREAARSGDAKSGRAERYRKVADEYLELAGAASTPFLRGYYHRVADQYRQHAERDLRIAEQDGAAARELTTKP
jgi:hypothetical protein